MLKNIARLESSVGGKIGHLLLDNDTPLENVKEMLFQFMAFVGQLEQQQKAQVEAQKAQEAQQAPVGDEASKVVNMNQEAPVECSACV